MSERRVKSPFSADFLKGDWTEDKHPRDETGRFSSGSPQPGVLDAKMRESLKDAIGNAIYRGHAHGRLEIAQSNEDQATFVAVSGSYGGWRGARDVQDKMETAINRELTRLGNDDNFVVETSAKADYHAGNTLPRIVVTARVRRKK